VSDLPDDAEAQPGTGQRVHRAVRRRLGQRRRVLPVVDASHLLIGEPNT
jgi:hypothetical protein